MGLMAANDITMMFGVHGPEKNGGGFVAGPLLPAASFHKPAFADAPEQAHQPHGLGTAHPAKGRLAGRGKRSVFLLANALGTTLGLANRAGGLTGGWSGPESSWIHS